MVTNDLIAEVSHSGKYYKAFVFKNPVSKRPQGQIMFVCEYKRYHGTPIKVTVINGGEELFMIGQVNVMKHEDEHLINYEKLIEYQQRCKQDIRYPVLDIDNPLYNVEWHFSISHKYWVGILGELNQVQIPLRPLTSLYKGSTARTIFIKESSDYMHYHWSTEHELFSDAEKLIDKVLNTALDNMHTAYYKTPIES